MLVLNAVRNAVAGFSGVPGVIAISGGADSVALAIATIETGLCPVVFAHLNHQLRSEESDADQKFVEDLARSYDVVFECERRDVRAEAKATRENLENTARKLRYQFFTTVAKKHHAGWVATGHTANDQTETIAHRLLRGTGVRGLRGIADVKEMEQGIQLVRPLLKCSRTDVIDYIISKGEAYREDSSNADTRFTRNRIRHEMLAQLRNAVPNLDAMMNELAEVAKETYGILEERALELLHEVELPRAGPMIIIDAAACSGHVLSPLIPEMLQMVWDREKWPRGAIDAESLAPPDQDHPRRANGDGFSWQDSRSAG